MTTGQGHRLSEERRRLLGLADPVADEPGFLQGAADLAYEHGALAFFDEMRSGFRVVLGGAAGALRCAGRPRHLQHEDVRVAARGAVDGVPCPVANSHGNHAERTKPGSA